MLRPSQIRIKCPACAEDHIIHVPKQPERGMHSRDVHCENINRLFTYVFATFHVQAFSNGAVLLAVSYRQPHNLAVLERCWICGEIPEKKLMHLYAHNYTPNDLSYAEGVYSWKDIINALKWWGYVELLITLTVFVGAVFVSKGIGDYLVAVVIGLLGLLLIHGFKEILVGLIGKIQRKS